MGALRLQFQIRPAMECASPKGRLLFIIKGSDIHAHCEATGLLQQASRNGRGHLKEFRKVNGAVLIHRLEGITTRTAQALQRGRPVGV